MWERLTGTRAKRFETVLTLFQSLQTVLNSNTASAALTGLALVNAPTAATLTTVKKVLETILPDIVKILEVIEASDDSELKAENIEAVVNKFLDLGYSDDKVDAAMSTIEKGFADGKLNIMETIKIFNELK